MGIADRLREQRNRQVLSRAEPHLSDGETVVEWVRVKHCEVPRKDGFAYVTEQRLLVRWQGRAEGHQAFGWEEVMSWGVEPEADGGPILHVESDAEDARIQMPARSPRVAQRISDFLRSFGKRAPKPRRAPRGPHADRLAPQAEVTVAQRRRTAIGQTKRIVVTIVGVALLAIAVLIIPLPGPWSILLSLAGLATLATEYDWAQDVADFFRDKYEDAKNKIKSRRRSTG